MARAAFSATYGTVAPSTGVPREPAAETSAQAVLLAAAVAAQPNPAAFEAALATLVADGAVPTQAHVTAANNAYTTLKNAQTAYVAAVNAISLAALTTALGADVTLLVNGTGSTQNKFLAAVRAILQDVAGSSIVAR